MKNKTITLTVPDPIYVALERAGRLLGESPSELLKAGLRQAMMSEAGWHLRLERPTEPKDGSQLELSLTAGEEACDG